MKLSTFVVGGIVTTFCVFVLNVLGDRWPVLKRVALALAALFILYFGVDGLLGSLEEIGRGRVSVITRAGSRVVSLQAKHPLLFWMNAIARLVGCICLILGGLWTLREAVKRR